MLRSVNVGNRSLADYHSIISRELMGEIHDLAARLQDKRVCHINATSFGGGVAEIMYCLVPLMNDVGLKADWLVMFGQDEFFNVTKAMHNTLQGDPREITAEEQAVFERYNVLNAGGLSGDYDYVIIHDPQPAAIKPNAQLNGDAKWIWRCHIDLSTPNPQVLDWLMSYVQDYDLSVFHMAEYIPPGNRAPDPVIMPPAIDALAPKNMALSNEDAAYIVNQFGLDTERPMILQVSRFDPWKDPLGVIDAYRIAKQRYPDLQLALIGSMAADDPEGMEYYQRTVDHAGDDEDIYILSNLDNVGGVEVNAFQTHAAAVLQKSIKEGFGLTVTESLWKGRPTIAGNVGGIPLQIVNGETGYLVSSPEEAAARIIDVLDDPEAAKAMALRGKQHVRHDFLTPRLLRDWLGIFDRLS
ncbi:MAG: glycosyltransferase [Thermoleophilia bacterium]|nr:glycosyltransferase [Thermoleophilia bacterium]